MEPTPATAAAARGSIAAPVQLRTTRESRATQGSTVPISPLPSLVTAALGDLTRSVQLHNTVRLHHARQGLVAPSIDGVFPTAHIRLLAPSSNEHHSVGDQATAIHDVIANGPPSDAAPRNSCGKNAEGSSPANAGNKALRITSCCSGYTSTSIPFPSTTFSSLCETRRAN